MQNMILPSNNVLYLPGNIDIRICPKNGMSSIRVALMAYYGQYDEENLKVSFGLWREKMIDQYATDGIFRKDSYRIAVARDPVYRFVSACEFLANATEAQVYPKVDMPDTLNEVIEQIKSGKLDDQHLKSQTHYMGSSQDYDWVVPISELKELLTYIESVCKIDGMGVRDLHLNRTRSVDRPATYEKKFDVDAVREIYKIDYENGWIDEKYSESF